MVVVGANDFGSSEVDLNIMAPDHSGTITGHDLANVASGY
jgi:hypothetical protein